MQMGSLVIIENVHNKLSELIHPYICMGEIKKVVGKENECMLNGKSVPISFDFEMLITTSINNPDFGAEISEHLIFVNFELSEGAFE